MTAAGFTTTVSVVTKEIHMSETLDTWVAIITMLLITSRWLYLEIYSEGKIFDQSIELINYSSKVIRLENKLRTTKKELICRRKELTSLQEENKHLQEEINKIREITDQWRLKT